MCNEKDMNTVQEEINIDLNKFVENEKCQFFWYNYGEI